MPDARLLLVCGPRIDPGAIEPVEGMEVVGYVHDLFRTLACCDLAVVQGGLTTTMELVANRRPFISIPLRNHFEQNHHVAHRLRRYGAPPPTPYDEATPEVLAALMRERLGAPVDYLPVETGGAARAAQAIARVLEGQNRSAISARPARRSVGRDRQVVDRPASASSASAVGDRVSDRPARSPSAGPRRSAAGGGRTCSCCSKWSREREVEERPAAAVSSMQVVRPPWTTAMSHAARCRYEPVDVAVHLDARPAAATPGRSADRRPATMRSSGRRAAAAGYAAMHAAQQVARRRRSRRRDDADGLVVGVAELRARSATRSAAAAGRSP